MREQKKYRERLMDIGLQGSCFNVVVKVLILIE
jgi:hypothetical protein